MRARVASVESDLKKLVEEAKKDEDTDAETTKEAEALLEAERKGVTEVPEEPVDTSAPTIYKDGVSRYTAKTQPRDAQGKFRLVLARLKQDLGTSGNQDVVEKLEATQGLDDAGNYKQAVESAADLINTVDRLDSGALNAKSVESVRASTAQLGEVIANLPLPFDNQAQKVRYSDLPAALKTLVENLITKVEAKIGKKDADEATQEMRSFMSGGDYFSQAEVSAQMNRLLRLLT